jgi:hypothetical protein
MAMSPRKKMAMGKGSKAKKSPVKKMRMGGMAGSMPDDGMVGAMAKGGAVKKMRGGGMVAAVAWSENARRRHG